MTLWLASHACIRIRRAGCAPLPVPSLFGGPPPLFHHPLIPLVVPLKALLNEPPHIGQRRAVKNRRYAVPGIGEDGMTISYTSSGGICRKMGYSSKYSITPGRCLSAIACPSFFVYCPCGQDRGPVAPERATEEKKTEKRTKNRHRRYRGASLRMKFDGAFCQP